LKEKESLRKNKKTDTTPQHMCHEKGGNQRGKFFFKGQIEHKTKLYQRKTQLNGNSSRKRAARGASGDNTGSRYSENRPPSWGGNTGGGGLGGSSKQARWARNPLPGPKNNNLKRGSYEGDDQRRSPRRGAYQGTEFGDEVVKILKDWWETGRGKVNHGRREEI